MQRSAFVSSLRASRFAVALLLMLGILLPLLMLFELGGQAPLALVYALVTLLLLNLTTIKKWKWFALGGMGVFLLVQVFLPGMGFFGASMEALKAVSLYFSNVTVAMPLFGSQVAALLAVGVAFASFLFSKRGAGFLPATIMVVLVLVGLWTLQKGGLVWYALPALVALLLLISQTAHEKISTLNVLPMALAVVLLALLLLPGGHVSIQPLEKAAFDLKQTISDYLFFTEPRNVFTLGAYGYYPLGGGQLGGEAEPNENPVMVVKTDRKTLMRAVVKDDYTGRSFRDTSSARRYLYVHPRWASIRAQVFLETLPAESIRKASALLDEKAVTVQMERNATSTVFTPLYLRSLNMPGNMVPYFNDASELYITRDLTVGDRYTVYAPVFEGGDGGLSALVNSAVKNDKEYAAIYSQYTRLPSHMEQKVYDDVANIIKAEDTPYDKAMAIMRHLQKYYRYTLSPKTPPENNDFVTYFLYVGREGYCTYYAAAMTVMCRMAGLPARYVEGFLSMPAGDGLAYVTGKDAHAWTEVYFEGFGWVPFDPTPQQQGESETPPNQEEPEPSPPPESPEDEPEPTPPPEIPEDNPEPPPPDLDQDTESEDPSANKPDDSKWWVWVLVGLALVSAVGIRCYVRMPQRVAAKKATEQDKIFVYGNAVHAIARLRGRTPKKGEPPLMFARRLDSIRAFPAPLLPLWRAMALSSYSRRKPSPEQTAKAKETFENIFKAQPLLIKLRFLLSAGFSPRLYSALSTVLVHEEPVSKTTLPQPGSQNKKGKAAKTVRKKPAKSAAPGQPLKKNTVRATARHKKKKR